MQDDNKNEAQDILTTIFNVILYFITFPVETISRKRFGERYYGVGGFAATLFFLGIGTAAIFATPSQYGSPTVKDVPNNGEWYIAFFFLAVGIMGIVHFIDIFRRERKGIFWHSRSPGIPRINFGNPWRMILFGEPILWIFIAFLTYQYGSLMDEGDKNANPDGLYYLSYYFLVASGALLIKSMMMWANMRQRILGDRDAELQSKDVMGMVSEDKTSFSLPDHVVESAPIILPSNDEQGKQSAKEAYENLSPGLKKILAISE